MSTKKQTYRTFKEVRANYVLFHTKFSFSLNQYLELTMYKLV